MKKLFVLFIFLSTAILLGGCNSKNDEVVESKAESEPKAEAKSESESKAKLPAGITLIEEFKGDENSIAIPYSKYKLANGLTVVLHQDHSDPLVHVDVTYHVGSNREEVGRSGFAHFFEHMMFQGSANVADEQHFKIVSNAGGTLNGTTNSDRTNYFQTMPVNQLEIALWLEADRMGFLLEAVTEEKFEVQRETVKNERGQRVDNQPYGRAGETLQKTLYAEKHPYSWPVIGWLEDLNRADLADLKRFFLRWYGPNNAALTIGGDIDPMVTLELVNKYFGSIPAGPEVKNLERQAGQLDTDRYVTLEDNIHLPALALIMPTVYMGHEDEAALNAAAKILGQGQASMLYQSLVQTGRAVQASVSHSCRELACEMMFIVIQNTGSGETLAEMEKEVRKTLVEFGKREISEDDLTKFKAQYESRRVFGLQSVSGKVSTLAAFQTYTGSPAGIGDEIQRFLGISTDDVRRVFNQYIAGKPSVILSIVPNGKTEIAAAVQNYQTANRHIPESFGDEGKALALRPATDTFDRSKTPTPGINPSVELPTISDFSLSNDIRVLSVPNTEIPTTTVRAVFDVGSRDEAAGKAGLTSLTTALMGEATKNYSAAEFAEALERIGASISIREGTYQTTVTLNTLNKHLNKGMELMLERVLRPEFTEADFDRIKSQTMEVLIAARKVPAGLAGRAVYAVLYGPTHPLSYTGAGLPSTVESISLDDVKAHYSKYIPSHLGGITISSALNKAEITDILSGFAELEIADTPRQTIAGPVEIKGRTLYLVNKEGAAQSSLRTIQPALKYDAFGDYHLANLSNFNLGGTFNSRINLNLREDKGYTYGARSGFYGGKEFGSFGASTDVKKDATAASITEILNELKRFSDDGMTEDEFNFMRSAIGQRDALQYETPGRKLGLLDSILRYDLPLDYRSQQNALLESTNRNTLNELASKYIDTDNMAIVVVGDEAAIREELEALGMPIKMLDEDGFEVEASK